jgi:1,4-dihydroxy-2-naphthoyl-CoA hydrolase
MAIWREQEPDLAQIMARDGGTMIEHLAIEIVGHGDDWLRARMPVDTGPCSRRGRLHGGASVVLAETVGSIAANMVLDPSEQLAVGLDINANHIRPVKSGFVYGTARPSRSGRSTQVWSIRITDERTGWCASLG